MKEELHGLANHIAGAKGGLPQDWQDWANEIEMDLRKLANWEAQPVALVDRRPAASGGICWQHGSKDLQHGTELFTVPPAPANARAVAWEMRYWNSGYNMWHDWERITAEQHAEMSVLHAADNDYEFRVLYDAPPKPQSTNSSDWGINMQTGTPILTYKNCCVIESEQAHYVLSLINRAATPAPAVPDELLDAMEEVIRISDRDHEAWDKAKAAITACRAAMLAQPVSQRYTLPDGWIACGERMPEVGEHDWRTALPVLVKCEIGVIPAYYGFTYHEGEQCFGFMESIKFGDASGSSPEQHENRLMMHVTHWMPLPAAPEGGN
ncbi:hypothetical protein SME53J_21740 [Serratia marcescens]|nr:hypothetical protein SME53J_21740 [Serratia marcescens]